MYGNIIIFDRSWYGRVLVERIEGFAKEEGMEKGVLMKSMTLKELLIR